MDDSAFFYFIKAKDLFLLQKDSLGAGKCLVNMGIISAEKGDYFGSQELSLNALSYFNQKKEAQHVFICANFNNLGVATYNLKDYPNALRFYDEAVRFSKNPLNTRVYLNNKAKVYQDIKDYKSALKIFNQVLKGTQKDKKEYARALTNISNTRFLQDPKYNPLPNYLKALRLREEERDLLGLNSSYSHLSDYYAAKESDSAVFYAEKMYLVDKELNRTQEQLEALQKLIKMSPENESKRYFEIYQKLDDSVQTVRRNAKNQFALIRYETEKHKADFLNVQAENIQKKNNILVQNFILVILGLGLISGYLWYRRRNKTLLQEKELEVKKTELKYVKKIHDRVANKVYHVMSEVENSNEVNKDDLLDKLEILYNISRDISYESKELNTAKNYSGQLSEMLKSYSSEFTEVLLVGNEEELWECIDNAGKAELFYILQELMTNMRKHSKAETVILKFQRNDLDINILYSDDGVGMKDSSKKNGLTNTENRIKSIRGTIIFDHTLEKGLGINLLFPFS